MSKRYKSSCKYNNYVKRQFVPEVFNHILKIKVHLHTKTTVWLVIKSTYRKQPSIYYVTRGSCLNPYNPIDP